MPNDEVSQMNEAEFLNSMHESDSILENEVQDTLDGSEVEKEDANPLAPSRKVQCPKKQNEAKK